MPKTLETYELKLFVILKRISASFSTDYYYYDQ